MYAIRSYYAFVNEDRLRFDFTHFSAMSRDEIMQVEKLVNDKIMENLDVATKVMNVEEAKKSGAMALFGEKYTDDVLEIHRRGPIQMVSKVPINNLSYNFV